MTAHRAIDVRCPTCGAPPGQTCRWLDHPLSAPHVARKQAATAATAKADPARCDRCGRPWNTHAIRHRAQP